MARGRIIVSDITKDKRVNDLSDDTSRLAFTWLVTFADSAGRTHGDPAVVRSMLFPRREDVTIAQMARYIGEWAACGLVVWYECDGDQWIAFPSFAKHQVGFDKRHEPKSTIPDPPQTMPDSEPDGVRTLYVQSTAEVKRSEVNTATLESPHSGGNGLGADAPPAVVSAVKKSRRPPTRSEADTKLMHAFCVVTGFDVPQRVRDANWWYATLREILPFVDNDVGRAVGLINDTVRHMRSGKEPLTITSPKSIVGMARSLAKTKAVGYEL